jgi:hypothetical protein
MNSCLKTTFETARKVRDASLLLDGLIVFNATFSNIMATSFNGGGSRSTWREPPTMGKQLVNFIIYI